MHTLAEIAASLAGELHGEGQLEISTLSPYDAAEPGSLVVAFTEKALTKALTGLAAAVVIPSGLTCDLPCISVENPARALLTLAGMFAPDEGWEPGIHPKAAVHDSAEVPDNAVIGPYAVIGKGTKLGQRCRIGAHAVVDAYCVLGDDVTIHANATLYPRVKAGNRVVVHSGAVIGGNGFGFYEDGDGFTRKPQIGSTILEDDVEIGCNTCVDRATLGYTVVARGCKLDNLVQVAHNVQLGAHARLAAQVGIAGSTQIGDRAILGGQVGIGDHLHLTDNIVLGGQSGTVSDLKESGAFMGTPPVQLKEYFRISAALRRLPELLKRVAKLEKERRESEA